MFFLGIAGPLLPYFLMIGVLVAFTLEAGAGVLRKPENENTGHHLRLAVAESGTAAPESSFYFIDRADQTQNQNIDRNFSPVTPGLLIPEAEHGTRICCRNARLRLAGYVDTYFGLSPPCMDV